MIPELSDLAKQGPAWVLLCLSIGVIVYLFKLLTKEREQCSTDFRNVIAGNTLQLKSQEEMNIARLRIMETQTRALELMTAALNQLTAQIEIVNGTVKEAMNSNREMREALLRKGVDL